MMRKLLLMAAALLSICSCSQNRFASLDKVFDSKDSIDEMMHRRTDSLRLLLAAATVDSLRWDCAEDLYEEWRHLNLDSCRSYTHLMLSLAGNDQSRILRSKAAVVRNLVRAERMPLADSVFKSIILPEKASSADLAAYFYCADRLTTYLYSSDKEETRRRLTALCDEYLRRDSSSVKARLFETKALRYTGNLGKAFSRLREIDAERIDDVYDLSSYYMSFASLYFDQGNYEASMENAAKSAEIDLASGMKDYYSLYLLAQMLFSEGRTREAARYMNRAVQDAVEYNYPAGVRRSASAAVIMNDAIQSMEHNRKVLLYTTLSIISLLLLVALVLLFFTQDMLHKVRGMQHALKNVSLIKDRMLGEYMELSSKYIYKVDENKSKYRKVLKEEGADVLMGIFREPSFADAEFPNYWRDFDKTFLSIFPSFVEKVNALMPADKHFVQEIPGRLTTELRILALIRLGISDSKRISVILHVSKGTVYTYRSVMRQNSLDPDSFEENIRKIEDL